MLIYFVTFFECHYLMKEHDYRFTPNKANLANQGISQSVDHFTRAPESVGVSELNEIIGPVVLTQECISELDAALDVAGFMPTDLQSVDANALQNEFALLNDANDWQARKIVFNRILELVKSSQ